MTVFPLSAALISLVCAAIASRRYGERRRPHELAWGIAFGFFALGAFAEVIGDLDGWSPLLTRLYYVSGAILTVGFLGLGSLSLLIGPRLERWVPGIMLALAATGFAFVFNTPVDTMRLDRGWEALETDGTPTLVLTILINTVGTLIVVGGALYSAYAGWRRGMPRDRVIGLVLIAAGTLLVASGGTVYRALGDHAYFYTTMAPGVAIILLGYLQANRAAPKGRPVVTLDQAGPTPAGGSDRAPATHDREVLGGGTAPSQREQPVRPAPEGLTIRPLGPADAGAVRAVLGCSGAASPLTTTVHYQSDEAVAALLARPEATWLGAELAGQVVAVARLVPGAEAATRHTAQLAPLAVGDDYSGRGVGAALLAEVLHWADAVMGLARLAIWVYPEDERAVRFYERRGFEREGVLANALFAGGRHRAVLLMARTRG